MTRKYKQKVQFIAWTVGLVVAILSQVFNIFFNLDRWVLESSGFPVGVLQFAEVTELRLISAVFMTSAISILVFLPALVSIAKSQEENLRLTVIERNHVANLGDATSVLIFAAFCSFYSLFTVLVTGYFVLGVQAILLVILVLLTFFKLRTVLSFSRNSESTFFDDALLEFEEEMEEISKDESLLRNRGKSFKKEIEKLGLKESSIPLYFSFNLRSTHQGVVAIEPDKRIKAIDIGPCVGFLNDKLLSTGDQEEDIGEKKEQLKNYQIKIIDPFKYGAYGATVPILSIEVRRGFDAEVDLTDLSNGASQILQKNTKFEAEPKHTFEVTRGQITQDFAESLRLKNSRRIRRNFDLLERLIKSISSSESELRKSLLFSFASDMAQEILVAGDVHMSSNATRRLVLDSTYSLIREAVRRDHWYLLDRFGGAVSSLLRIELKKSGEYSLSSLQFLHSELHHFALVVYELVWILRRKSTEIPGIEAFYARQMFNIFRIVIDRFIEEENSELSEKSLIDLLGLLRRYFTSAQRNTLGVRVGGMILLSMQSYTLFKLNEISLYRARKLTNFLFNQYIPNDFYFIASTLNDLEVIEDLNWDLWAMEDTGFGGGYVFSSSNLYASCAFMYWAIKDDRQWLDNLTINQLEFLKQNYDSESVNLFDEVSEKEVSRKASEIEGLINERKIAEYQRVINTDVDKNQLDKFFNIFENVLNDSDFISLARRISVQDIETSEVNKIFSLGMPKVWFIDNIEEFPLEDDGVVQRSIARQLLAQFLRNVGSAIEEVDKTDLETLSDRAKVVLTNYPDVGIDPFEDLVGELFDRKRSEAEVITFRSRALPAAVWVFDSDDIELLSSRAYQDKWKSLGASLYADIIFGEDKAKLMVKFGGRFQVCANKKIYMFKLDENIH